MPRNKPNFFIVGAAKAGTSSLWQYLKQHPQVFMPTDELNKEPRYFNRIEKFRSIDDYFELFDKAESTQIRVGEASTAYLTDIDCAEVLCQYGQQHNLDIKILVILRNPADRAYSLYNWMVQDGYEYSGSFKAALKKEERRLKGTSPFWEPNNYYNYLYFHSGLYSEQLKRYQTFFGKEQLHVEIFEHFVEDTLSSFKRICQFLEIDDQFVPNLKKVYNPSYQVISPALQFWLRKLTKLIFRYPILGIKSKAQRDTLLKWGLTKKKVPKLSKAIKKELLTKYRPDIERLEKITGKNLSVWLS